MSIQSSPDEGSASFPRTPVGPEYLGAQHVPSRRVRCPVHGFIRYSEAEQKIIDHESFQRLRNIRQLAFTHYLYPGATHTRFEHCLGVMELASQAFDVLTAQNGRLLQENFEALPDFADQPLAKARQLVRLMGLLHDIGHTAFSHAGEVILPHKHHELVSAWVVSGEGPLGPLLDREFFPGVSDYLSKMLAEKTEEIPPQLFVLKQLISGQLDLDRIDYLLRDSLHCGVGYGRFDHLRLINSLTVHRNPETQSLAVGVDPGGFHAFEALLLARYYMNTQVYAHRVRRAYDLLLQRWLEAWGPDHYVSPAQVLQFDDISLTAQMQMDVQGRFGEERSRWAQRLMSRNHPRTIWECGDHADYQDHKRGERIYAKLVEEFPNSELFFDDHSGSIHKLYVRGDQESVDDLFIVERDGTTEPVGVRSKIIEKIPKSFRTIRIFAYCASQEERRALEQRARDLQHVV